MIRINYKSVVVLSTGIKEPNWLKAIMAVSSWACLVYELFTWLLAMYRRVGSSSTGCLAPSQRAYYIDIIGYYDPFDFTNVVNGRFFAVNGKKTKSPQISVLHRHPRAYIFIAQPFYFNFLLSLANYPYWACLMYLAAVLPIRAAIAIFHLVSLLHHPRSNFFGSNPFNNTFFNEFFHYHLNWPTWFPHYLW